MEPSSEKKKILIIEDDTSMLNLLNESFESEGFRTIEASDGETGLKKALSEKPDIILLDIVLPIMDGLTMLRKLRTTNEFGRTVPVIFLTNLSPDNEKINNSIVENEPAYYLVKSNWSLGELVEKVKERLSRP